MPVLQDRVQETTTTGGTGAITLAGAVTGYRSFAQAFSIGDITYYTIDNGNGEWEIGVGTVGSGTLSRDSVLESSNSNALVNFSAGTKRVFCSAPTKVLLPNETGNSGKVLTTNGTDPSWTTTLNGMTIGNITPGSGAFTTLSASSTVSGTGFSTYLASPPAIGGTTPAAGSFTTLSSTGNTTLGDASADTLTINAGTTTFAQGTANGVLYLNGSKVATSGSGLVFDGTNLVAFGSVKAGNGNTSLEYSSGIGYLWTYAGTGLSLGVNNSETARLTSKGLLVGYTSDSGLSGTGNAIFSGNVGIGTTSANGKFGVESTTNGKVIYGWYTPNSGFTDAIFVSEFRGYSPNNATARFLYCGDNTAERCTIRSNGGIANYSANNVNLASDRRLKNTIEPVKSYWDVFKNIDWVTWFYNDQPDTRKNIGVIAQDLQIIAPELICESGKEAPEGEDPYLGLYDQDFKMAAMSVITQLVNKMDELHQEIELLKAKVN